MTVVLGVLTVAAMAGVLGVLFAGMIGVVRGGAADDEAAASAGRRSNRLMRWRVLLQAIAILLFILLLYSLKS